MSGKQEYDDQARHPDERFVRALARINNAITEASNIDEMFTSVLDEMLDIFDCERAALLYPCDPEAPTWSVPMARWRPGWPALQPSDGPQPMTEYSAYAMRLTREQDGPARFDPEEHPLDQEQEIVKTHSIRSQMAMALYPKNDHPWQVVLHHCVEPRVYRDEVALFQAIGHRLADGITTLIVQEQLRESEKKFRNLVANVPGAVYRSNEQGTIEFISDKVQMICGYPPSDLIDNRVRTFASLVLPDDLDRVRKVVAACSPDVPEIDVEYRILCANGSIRWIHDRAVATYEEKGELRWTDGVIVDITDRKRAEEALRENEARAQQVQRMESLGVLAGGVAHDFNNMLAAITGYAEIAMKELDPSSEVYDLLQQQVLAATRASEMVEQILTFGRRAEGERRVIGLGPIVEEGVKLLRSTLPSSIAIRHVIDPDVPLVLADATQIQQVIVNLGTNAHHAMKSKGGELSLHLTAHRIDATDVALNPEAREGDYACLIVRDTGEGIRPEILDRIFEPFFTTKEIGEGSGMGLATSHGIVASHGGFMTVESKVAAGSAFHVYLPAAEGDSEEQAVQDSQWVLQGHERVLVVDDEPIVLEMTTRLLEAGGYQVTPFSSSSDALTALEQSPHSWDLLLTDQTMPGMSGVELLQAARSVRADLRVVIMTGHSDKLTVDADGGVGADAVLRKPFRFERLTAVIRQVLARDA
jgi:PAS domain S-box-containing protein